MPSPSKPRRALRACATSRRRFWLGETAIVADATTPGAAARYLKHRLDILLDDGGPLDIRVARGEVDLGRGGHNRIPRAWREQWQRAAAKARDDGELSSTLPEAGLLLEIRLDATRWLNATMVVPLGTARPSVAHPRGAVAIRHDLRTPITTLRLRVELVHDAARKSRMLKTLKKMQALTEAGLLLARDTAAEESTRAVDLQALVDSVVGDLADQGERPLARVKRRPEW